VTLLGAAAFAALSAVALAAGGCARALPEEGSADAALYVQRCGSCHAVQHPKTLTAAMWQVQVDRMDSKFRGARMKPPEGEERARILEYLKRNAGR
jgi:hypothetical protein